MHKQIHTTVLIFWAAAVSANVEKVIFRAPASIAVPTTHPNLDDLFLDRISPVHLSLRTQLAAEFPQDNSPKGKVSWFLLDGLEPGRRYETRICWAATVRSPSLFTTSLSTFTHRSMAHIDSEKLTPDIPLSNQRSSGSFHTR